MLLLWYSMQLSHGVHWCICRVRKCGRRTREPPVAQRATFVQLDEHEGDLFCGIKQRAGVRDVVLRLEVMSAAEAKLRKGIVSFFVVLGYSAVVVSTVFKTRNWQKDQNQLLRGDAYSISAICVATTSAFTALLIRTLVFLKRVVQTLSRGDSWAPRRRRMATLALANAITQLINVACWIAPNAVIVGNFNHRKCAWFSTAINVLGVVRWTCWNTTFLIWIIMAHCLEVSLPYKQGAAPKAAMQVSGKMVLDQPLTRHWKKLILWAAFEAMAALLIVPSTAGPADQQPLHAETETDCRQWDWSPVCKYSPLSSWASIGISVLSGCYSWIYTAHIVKTHWQLERQLFTDTRAARVLWCIQAESTLFAFHAIFLSQNVLWFSNSYSCWSYILSWTGMLPLQLVASAVAWQNCWLFTPLPTGKHDPIIQVWLQEFAWAEASKPQKLADRNAHAQSKHEHSVLSQQPMFCFETAVKLHVWSCLVYTDVGQPAAAREQERKEWWRTELAGWSRAAKETTEERNIIQGQIHATAQPSGLWSEEETIPEEWDDHALSEAERGRSTSLDSPYCANGSPKQPFAAALRDGETAMGMRPSTSSSRSGLDDWLCAEEGDSIHEAIQGPAGKRSQSMSRQQRRVRAARLLRTGMGEYSLTDLETFWDKEFDTKALLGWNRHTVVLSFRGTASWANACADIKVWRMPHEPVRGMLWAGTRPMVHAGFYTLWTSNSFGCQVLAHLQRLVEAGEVQRDAHICVTGHSLGGALAMLAAHDIATLYPDCRMQVYSFACPYTGNHAFARDFQALVPDTWNVMEERDPVPKAGKFFCFFKRPGHRVVINQKGELLVRPNPLELQIMQPSRVSNHTNASYRAAMLAVCLAQFSSCGLRGGAKGVLEMAKSPFVGEDLRHDGLDFHKLRRLACWGLVGSSRVAPPSPNELRLLMAPADAQSLRHKWKPRPAKSPWAREPRLTLAALQRYRDNLKEGEEDACEGARD